MNAWNYTLPNQMHIYALSKLHNSRMQLNIPEQCDMRSVFNKF